MKITANIDGEQVELTPDQLQFGEGYALITPDSVPEGYYNKAAVTKLVEDNKIKAYKKKREELEADEEFHQQILGKYNISLGEDGKPKGLKPEFDPEEWKREQAKKLTQPYEEKLEKLNKELDKRNRAVVEGAILQATSGKFQDQWVKDRDGVIPIVKQYGDLFRADENGRAAKVDQNGDFEVDGQGNRITPEVYFSNESLFSDMWKDNRQSGSGFGGSGGSGAASFTREQVQKMSHEEYAKNQEAILKAAAEGRIT